MLATTQWPLERAADLTSLVWVCVLWLPESLMDLSVLCFPTEDDEMLVPVSITFLQSWGITQREVGNRSEHVHDVVTERWQTTTSLQWCHNERDSVSNHKPHDCLLNCVFRRRSKKTTKLRVTGLFAGNSPGTGEFPAQMASYAENVSIWWRHHVMTSRSTTPSGVTRS